MRAATHSTSFARRVGAAAGLSIALLLASTARPARADDGEALFPLAAAARPQPRSGTPLVAPTTTSTTTTTVFPLPVNRTDPLCRSKLKLRAQLEREKARAITLLARATDRLRRARGNSKPAVVAAFQKEVASNQERVDEIEEYLDLLEQRCA